eukprot:scpid100503/ scgid13302/ 
MTCRWKLQSNPRISLAIRILRHSSDDSEPIGFGNWHVCVCDYFVNNLNLATARSQHYLLCFDEPFPLHSSYGDLLIFLFGMHVPKMPLPEAYLVPLHAASVHTYLK